MRERQEAVSSSASKRSNTIANLVKSPRPANTRERLEIRNALGLAESDIVFLFMSRLDPGKQPLLAVEAAKKIIRKNRNAVFLFVGNGELADDCRSRAEENERIRFFGFRTDTENLLAASDVYFLPSLYENLSIGVIEAMSYRLPVVASDIPGIRESTGDHAILVGTTDTNAYVHGLSDLLVAERRREMGSMAFERYQTLFRADTILRKHQDVYERLGKNYE